MKVKSLVSNQTSSKRIALEIDCDISSEVFKRAFKNEGRYKFQQEFPGSIIYVSGAIPIIPKDLISYVETQLAEAHEEIELENEQEASNHKKMVEGFANTLGIPIS